MDNPTPATIVGVGHNLPTADAIVEELATRNADALQRTADLLAKGEEFFTIKSDEEDSAATEFMVKNRARWKASEADRVAEKSPWDDRAGAVHAFFKTRILDPLTGMGNKINDAQTAFKRAKAEEERVKREAEARRLREVEEAARREREAAERLQREAEETSRREAAAREAQARKLAEEAAAAAGRKRSAESRAAAEAAAVEARKAADEAAARRRQEEADAAAAREQRAEVALAEENKLAEERARADEAASATLADLSRSRGGRGGVASLREFIDFRDINRETLDYRLLGPYFKDAAVEAALRAYADANKATVNTGIKTNNQPVAGVVFFMNAKNAGRA